MGAGWGAQTVAGVQRADGKWLLVFGVAGELMLRVVRVEGDGVVVGGRSLCSEVRRSGNVPGFFQGQRMRTQRASGDVLFLYLNS